MDGLSRELEALEPDVRAYVDELGQIFKDISSRQDRAEEQALNCSLALSPLSVTPAGYTEVQQRISRARKNMEELVARVGALQRRAGEAAARASRVLQRLQGELDAAGKELSGLISASRQEIAPKEAS